MTAILSIPVAIVDGIKDALQFLFVPSEGYFQGKIDKLTERFGFADSIVTNFTMIVSFFTDTDFSEVPNAQVDLGLANSTTVKYFGKIEGLDLSWYAPYKPKVDKLVSGFLWIAFIWNLYKHLPSIINGVGSGAVISAKIEQNGGGDI